MKKETIKRYKAATLAAIVLALSIYGTSCTVSSNEDTKSSAIESTQTEQEETIKELTEADLEGKTLDELWEKVYEMRTLVTKERIIIDNLQEEITSYTILVHEDKRKLDYLTTNADQDDKEVKKQIKSLEKSIQENKEKLTELQKQYDSHNNYRKSLNKTLDIYYAKIEELGFER